MANSQPESEEAWVELQTNLLQEILKTEREVRDGRDAQQTITKSIKTACWAMVILYPIGIGLVLWFLIQLLGKIEALQTILLSR